MLSLELPGPGWEIPGDLCGCGLEMVFLGNRETSAGYNLKPTLQRSHFLQGELTLVNWRSIVTEGERQVPHGSCYLCASDDNKMDTALPSYLEGYIGKTLHLVRLSDWTVKLKYCPTEAFPLHSHAPLASLPITRNYKHNSTIILRSLSFIFIARPH